ncbi:MAG: hypothetical protein M1835_005415 [Candelina submexicana]|nr:MAG: hypothetical protein M1835_005415 [Candelina submexicana]
MTVTGVYFIPDSAGAPTLENIKDKLIKRYQPQPQARWTLEHRLMRETVPSNVTEDNNPRALRYLQILSLSHHEGKSYLNISAPQSQTGAQSTASTPMPDGGNDQVQAATMVTVPQGQTVELVQLMATKMGPLWTQRQTLHVSNGLSYDLQDFKVRLGEVKQGQNAILKGVIAELEWLAGSGSHTWGKQKDAETDDWETGELIIRALWEGLDIPGSRETIRVPGVGQEQGKGMDVARQYCEILRLR